MGRLGAVTVLAIDTSSLRRTVAVAATREGGLIRAEVRIGARVDESLPPIVAALIDPAPEAVVVVTGPGSYTGLRAGMAAALGVAHTLGVPLHGVGALQVVASGVADRPSRLWAAADAGRDGVFLAECEAAVEGWRSGTPRRVSTLALAGEVAASPGVRVASCDPLLAEDLIAVDPAVGLAGAVAGSLATDPLRAAGLSAEYLP